MSTDYILCHLQSVPCNVDHSIFLIKNAMCNVSCEQALFGSRAARERASERDRGKEPFAVNTISCGKFALTVFTFCVVPRFPGWKWKFMSDRCKLSFLSTSPPPPQPPLSPLLSSVPRASPFHDIPKLRACLQAKCNVQTQAYNILMLYIQQKPLKTSFTFLSLMVMLDWVLFPVSTTSFRFSLWQFVILIFCHFPCSSHRRETLSEKNRSASFFLYI